MTRRTAITVLLVLSAVPAEWLGAISLTRIANDHLGFPDYLEWTFPVAVSVGAIAGAIMWTTSRDDPDLRNTGVRLNLTCSLLLAVGVGLDHGVNATEDVLLEAVAFLVGAFFPLLSTWLVHLLANVPAKPRPVTQDETGAPKETTGSLAGDTAVPSRLGTEPVTRPVTRPVPRPEPEPVPLRSVPARPEPTAVELALDYIRDHGDTYRKGIRNSKGQPISKATHNRARARFREEVSA
jgi:hypothetical protein